METKRNSDILILGLIQARWDQIWAAIFFFSKIWLCQSLDITVSYHHVQYQKKTKDLILRKFSDGRGQTRIQNRLQYSRTLKTDELQLIQALVPEPEIPTLLSTDEVLKLAPEAVVRRCSSK